MPYADIVRQRQFEIDRSRANTEKMRRLKEVTPCADCGNIFPAVCMDFDHTTGQKHLKLSSMRNYSWEKILLEIEKCEIVCSNCHRIRTANRRNTLRVNRLEAAVL